MPSTSPTLLDEYAQQVLQEGADADCRATCEQVSSREGWTMVEREGRWEEAVEQRGGNSSRHGARTVLLTCVVVSSSLMFHGRNNGKKLMAVRIVAHAFEIINLLTDLNPIQVLVDAIVNTGPREDSTRIGSQGTVRRQAVDVSPLRRVNQALTLITTGARESAFRNVKSIAECLADELVNAAKVRRTALPSRRRMSWSVWPRATDEPRVEVVQGHRAQEKEERRSAYTMQPPRERGARPSARPSLLPFSVVPYSSSGSASRKCRPR
ncbi:hypothetical protein L7F22_023181 [Adiantum nelumboides]|nr:hypothetical protein [Adiantum nelumboides]